MLEGTGNSQCLCVCVSKSASISQSKVSHALFIASCLHLDLCALEHCPGENKRAGLSVNFSLNIPEDVSCITFDQS